MGIVIDNAIIIRGCIDGDRRSQQRLYEAYYGKMMAVCRRYAKDNDEALDIFQEAFIKVFNNIHKYGDKGSFEGWIRRIMVNTAIDFIRRAKAGGQTVELTDRHTDTMGNHDDEDEGDSILGNVSYDELLKCVQNLSPAYKQVFNLYVVDGYQHQEIAEMLNISVGTSKSNLAKAKMNLRKFLSEKMAVANSK
ncbi:MAG: RNA polymerase sigma factor [Flavobacteriales bacterium]